MRISDWSSDVCSSDLDDLVCAGGAGPGQEGDRDLAVAQVHAGGAHADQRGRQGRQPAAARGGGGVDDHVELAERAQVLVVARMHVLGQAQLVDQGVGAGAVARSEEHTSELQSLMRTSYAVFCLKKKKKII